MTNIEILENCIIQDYKKNANHLLDIEINLVKFHYDWITLFKSKNTLFGTGELCVNGNKYIIEIKYSPYFPSRFDRIYITNLKIEYNTSIHVYRDMSLCLYHPLFDKPLFKIIPLFKMIPWITEWCIHYKEWKKYGVWLGNEIKH